MFLITSLLFRNVALKLSGSDNLQVAGLHADSFVRLPDLLPSSGLSPALEYDSVQTPSPLPLPCFSMSGWGITRDLSFPILLLPSGKHEGMDI